MGNSDTTFNRFAIGLLLVAVPLVVLLGWTGLLVLVGVIGAWLLVYALVDG